MVMRENVANKTVAAIVGIQEGTKSENADDKGNGGKRTYKRCISDRVEDRYTY